MNIGGLMKQSGRVMQREVAGTVEKASLRVGESIGQRAASQGADRLVLGTRRQKLTATAAGLFPAEVTRGQLVRERALRDALPGYRPSSLNGSIFGILPGADFQGSRLKGMDFSRFKLNLADFKDTDLRGADFRGARLFGAGFSGADLRGADLRGALLDHASFHGTLLGTPGKHPGALLGDLRRASIEGAFMTRPDGRLVRLSDFDTRPSQILKGYGFHPWRKNEDGSFMTMADARNLRNTGVR
jgi:hypothetical protein